MAWNNKAQALQAIQPIGQQYYYQNQYLQNQHRQMALQQQQLQLMQNQYRQQGIQPIQPIQQNNVSYEMLRWAIIRSINQGN